ncbi:unnamed protein product [Closterium sp. NIES-53]
MQPSHRANRLVKILGSWTAAADNTCARQIASFNGNNASTGNRTNKGVSSDPTNNNSRDNSSSINISSGSRDNSTSINIGSSRDNNSTSTNRQLFISTNRQLFISTNSRYRHHTNSRPTADSRSTRRPQKRQHHCSDSLQTYLDNLAAERDLTGDFRGNRAFAAPADEADWDEQNVDRASEEAGPLSYCSVPVPMDNENPCESINAEVYYDFADNSYVTPQPVNMNV